MINQKNRKRRKKILLLSPHYDSRERSRVFKSIAAVLPSLGLLSLAAFIRDKGFEVTVCDASAERLSLQSLMRRIIESNADLIGITSSTPSIIRVKHLAEEIKAARLGSIIILGGPHSTAVPEETLMKLPSLDAVAVGEGEQTLFEVAERWPDKSWQNVPGIVYRDGDGIVHNSPRNLLPEIDLLPLPAWDLLNGFPRKFHSAIFKIKSWPASHLITSRGCPFKCIFCDASVFSHKVRYHSAEYVLEALSVLYHKYGVRELSFEDDMFMAKKDRITDICEGMLKKGLRFTWSCNAHVNAVRPEILTLFRKAGCWQIAYGLESGCQEILDFINKGITLDQARKALEITRSAGIRTRGFFIYGFPGETEDTLCRTLDFAKSLPLDDASLTFLAPFPGSELYSIASQYGKMESCWDRMTMLEISYVPKDLTKRIMEQWYSKFVRKFYFRPRILLYYLAKGISRPVIGYKLVISAINYFLSIIKRSGR